MPQSSNDVQISRAGRERIDDLEPLWDALRSHHVAIAPEIGEARSPGESWLHRKTEYETWLKEPTSFILLAEKENRPVGYALVRIKKDTSAIWHSADKVAEIETVSVLAKFRGLGIGAHLMEAIYTEARKEGVQELSLISVAANPQALAFYERQGFTQQFVHLGKRICDER
jgi:ribosomal protein S18 acetylase RimI-like enzyme